MAFDAKTNWQYNDIPTENDANRWEQGIADAHAELDPAAPVPVTIPQGVSIVHAGRTSRVKDLRITGRTLVNLLGRDGNCETLSGRWSSPYGGTASLDTTQSKIGKSCIKLSSDGSLGLAQVSINFKTDSSKYYLFCGYLKNGTGTGLRLWYNDNLSVYTITSTNWTFSYTKISAGAGPFTSFGFRVYGDAGEFGYADGLTLYEITEAEYDALDTMTADEIAAKYPYVDDMKHVNAVYVMNSGKNLIPPLTEWNVNSKARALGPYKLSLTPDATFQGSYVAVTAIPNQTYTLQGTVTGNGKLYADVRDTSGGHTYYPISESSVTFTTPPDVTVIEVLATNDSIVSGTMTFENFMLNVGSTALPFEPQQSSYLFLPDCNLRSNLDGSIADHIYMDESGKPRVVRHFREVVLDGSLTWTIGADYSGYKYARCLNVPPDMLTNSGMQDLIVDQNIQAIKFDGKPLRHSYTFAIDGPDCINIHSSGIDIAIADTDSGWGENYTPTADEIKAYFDGWKMYEFSGGHSVAYNGTGTKAWVERINIGTTAGTTNFDSVVKGKNGWFGSFTPYRLMYQLTQSIDEPITSEGALMLHDGPNQIEMGTGIIVREQNPIYWAANEGLYYVNADAGGYRTKYRTRKVEKVFRNTNADHLWRIVLNANLNPQRGLSYATIKPINYDPTAAYSVTYFALDTHLIGIAPASMTGVLTTNIKETVEDAVEAISMFYRDMSILRNTTSTLFKKSQPEFRKYDSLKT